MFILESKHCKNTGFLILKIKQMGTQKMKLNMSICSEEICTSALTKIEWLLPVFYAIQTHHLITNIVGRWFLCDSTPCLRNPTSTFLTIWENFLFFLMAGTHLFRKTQTSIFPRICRKHYFLCSTNSSVGENPERMCSTCDRNTLLWKMPTGAVTGLRGRVTCCAVSTCHARKHRWGFVLCAVGTPQ